MRVCVKFTQQLPVMLVSQTKMHNTLQTIKAKKSKELSGSQFLLTDSKTLAQTARLRS